VNSARCCGGQRSETQAVRWSKVFCAPMPANCELSSPLAAPSFDWRATGIFIAAGGAACCNLRLVNPLRTPVKITMPRGFPGRLINWTISQQS
jgi:hypothetical protein